MKFLRNPIAVGVLVVIALALVFRNALVPLWQRSKSTVSTWVQPSANNSPAPATATAAPVVAKPGSSKAATINMSLVSTASVAWIESPRRDPFRLRYNALGQSVSAAAVLTLNAVWQSASNSFAVINNRVLTKGESILDFQIDKIESDKVSVRSPQGVLETLNFKYAPPVAKPLDEISPETVR